MGVSRRASIASAVRACARRRAIRRCARRVNGSLDCISQPVLAAQGDADAPAQSRRRRRYCHTSHDTTILYTTILYYDNDSTIIFDTTLTIQYFTILYNTILYYTRLDYTIYTIILRRHSQRREVVRRARRLWRRCGEGGLGGGKCSIAGEQCSSRAVEQCGSLAV